MEKIPNFENTPQPDLRVHEKERAITLTLANGEIIDVEDFTWENNPPMFTYVGVDIDDEPVRIDLLNEAVEATILKVTVGDRVVFEVPKH